MDGWDECFFCDRGWDGMNVGERRGDERREVRKRGEKEGENVRDGLAVGSPFPSAAATQLHIVIATGFGQRECVLQFEREIPPLLLLSVCPTYNPTHDITKQQRAKKDIFVFERFDMRVLSKVFSFSFHSDLEFPFQSVCFFASM